MIRIGPRSFHRSVIVIPLSLVSPGQTTQRIKTAPLPRSITPPQALLRFSVFVSALRLAAHQRLFARSSIIFMSPRP